MTRVERTLMKKPLLLADALALAAAAAPATDRGWRVPGTTPLAMSGVQYSDEPVIPCRVVAFRTKDNGLDGMGRVTVCPVVRTPSGQVLRGFARTYPAGGV